MSDEKLYIFTVGCNGMKIDTIITLLQEHSIKLLLDTRLNTRYFRVGEFEGTKLKSHMEEAEIAYRHYLPLAPTNVMREEFKRDTSNHAWGNFLDSYHLYLEEFDPISADPEFVQLLQNSGRIALLCIEEHFEDCHRQAAAEYIKNSLGNVSVEHLMKHSPRRDPDKRITRGLT